MEFIRKVYFVIHFQTFEFHVSYIYISFRYCLFELILFEIKEIEISCLRFIQMCTMFLLYL